MWSRPESSACPIAGALPGAYLEDDIIRVWSGLGFTLDPVTRMIKTRWMWSPFDDPPAADIIAGLQYEWRKRSDQQVQEQNQQLAQQCQQLLQLIHGHEQQILLQQQQLQRSNMHKSQLAEKVEHFESWTLLLRSMMTFLKELSEWLLEDDWLDVQRKVKQQHKPTRWWFQIYPEIAGNDPNVTDIFQLCWGHTPNGLGYSLLRVGRPSPI